MGNNIKKTSLLIACTIILNSLIYCFLFSIFPADLENSINNRGVVSDEKSNDVHQDELRLICHPNLSLYEQWNATWGGNNNDRGERIEIDTEGNIYVAGTTDSVSSEDTNLALLKYNSSGGLLWSKSFDGPEGDYDTGYDVALDETNNFVYLCGYVEVRGFYYDMVLIQYNTDGVYQWNRTWTLDSGESSFGRSVVVNSTGYIFLSGKTGDNQFTITTYNSSGHNLKNETLSFEGEAFDPHMAIDSNDNIYLTGYNRTNAGSVLIFNTTLIKFNSSLEREWTRYFFDMSYNRTMSSGITIDKNDDIYLCGKLAYNFSYDASFWHIIKYNKSGDIVFNKTVIRGSTEEDERPYDITVDKNGNIFLVGTTNGTNSAQDRDLIVIKCDENGNYLFNWTWDSGQRDEGRGIYFNSMGYIVACGFTDVDQSASVNNDILLVNYSLSPMSFSLSLGDYLPGEFDNDGDVNLFWSSDAPFDAFNYTLYNHTSFITDINDTLEINIQDITETNYLLEDLSDGTYYYKIVAFNEYGNSTSDCEEIKVCRTPSNFDLSTNVTTPYDEDGIFGLNWSFSEFAENYSIYYKKEDPIDGNWDTDPLVEIYQSEISNQINGINVNFSSEANGIYYFLVVANNSYESFIQDVNSTSEVKIEIRMKPGDFSLSSDAEAPTDEDGNFQLTWTESNNREYYSLYFSESDFPDNFNNITRSDKVYLLYNGTDLQYDISNYETGTYFFKIFAFNDYGNTSTNVIEVDVELPIAPDDFTLEIGGYSPPYDTDGNIELIWTDSAPSGADNYTVYNYTSYITEINSSLGINAKEITDTTLLINNLEDGEYFFIVQAHNKYGNSTSTCQQIRILHTPGLFDVNVSAMEPFDNDGVFGLNWSESNRAETYSVYYRKDTIIPPDLTGSNLYQSGLSVNETSLDFSSYFNGLYYLVVVANNSLEEYSETRVSDNVNMTLGLIPAELTLSSSNAGTPTDQDGAFRLTWTASLNRENYSLYYSLSDIPDDYNNETRSDKVFQMYNGTGLFYDASEFDTGTYYFKIYAYNEYGNSSSDCITIEVLLPGDSTTPPTSDDDEDNGSSSDTQDDNMVWVIRAIIGGAISATVGIVIKQSYSSAKKRKQIVEKVARNFDKIENVEKFLKENLNYEEWKYLKEDWEKFKNHEISKREFIKKSKKTVGDRFTNLFTKSKKD
ncbi:MAG: hypothetical protein GF383_04050 [Candidatus Lokiarchaeota archaeon]|nr:hypothetical protein [Candidatus Lokiarchaeota archaeon]MBD3338898.1 hypothetical protein [Candidatus Lokiarchaeota archaeon]